MLLRTLATATVLVWTTVPRADTTVAKFHLGYDRGISFRYHPKGALGIGLVVRPGVGSRLYADSESDSRDVHAQASYSTEASMSDKGATVLAEALYKRALGRRFSLTPFVSIGGSYSTSRSRCTYEREYLESDPRYDRAETREVERTTREFLAQLGLMPGVEIGPFSAQFRLGLQGGIEKTDSPEQVQTSVKRTDRHFGLLYPVDIVRSIIVHVGF